MVDYVLVGINIAIFLFYLMIIITSIRIKKRLDNKVGMAFIYIIIAVLVLILIRIQQMFFEIEIINSISYFTDYVAIIFAILFFLAVFVFYREIKKINNKRTGIGGNLRNYKREFGKKIIR